MLANACEWPSESEIVLSDGLFISNSWFMLLKDERSTRACYAAIYIFHFRLNTALRGSP